MIVDFHRFPREKYLKYVLFYSLRDLFAIKCERLLNSVLADRGDMPPPPPPPAHAACCYLTEIGVRSDPFKSGEGRRRRGGREGLHARLLNQ